MLNPDIATELAFKGCDLWAPDEPRGLELPPPRWKDFFGNLQLLCCQVQERDFHAHSLTPILRAGTPAHV